MDLHQIAHLESLSGDPAVGRYQPELAEMAAARLRSLMHRTKKGMVLAHALEKLPDVRPSFTDTEQDRIRIGSATDLDAQQAAFLAEALRELKPWRKGPFDIFGIQLDSEWDSSIKWSRLAGHLGPQAGKRILDIGASCGYYMFRLAGSNPALVVGIEPYASYFFQYLALSRYLALPRMACLPLTLEEMPIMRRCFDTVLCMGILYHRRAPLDTLLTVHDLMAPGGQLVLETLIIEGDEEIALFPETRYARMNNIYFIPTVKCLTHWLKRCGFDRIRCVDISRTTGKEQRRTDWIDTQSLADFLDPTDFRKTIEGYPAPVRAMVLATVLPR